MSSLKPYSFCFDVVTRGSFANRAGLEIAITAGAALCMPCGETVPLPAPGSTVPAMRQLPAHRGAGRSDAGEGNRGRLTAPRKAGFTATTE